MWLRQIITLVSFVLLMILTAPSRLLAGETPNVIFIYCDDLGYNDVSCFGGSTSTPNIDTLAAEGVRFTDFYSVCCVCTPSRAGLLTGRYPSRSGLSNHVLFPYSTNGIPASEYTLGEAFKDMGYATACVGKWHLGHLSQYLPTNNGFDSYYGIPYSNDMNPSVVLENETTVMTLPTARDQQGVLTGDYTQKALEFINASHTSGDPFFLYLAHSMPHVPLSVSPAFDHDSDGVCEYSEVIEEIDWSVGQILSTLDTLGIDDDTLVIFSSDNGPWLSKGADGGNADPLRNGKGTVYDGGVREPTLARWPGTIAPGRVEARPAFMLDWFPTLVNICGGTMKTDRVYDGRDISGLLFDNGERSDYEFFLYSSSQGAQAYRTGDMKLWATGTPALYDLRADIGESTDLSSDQPDLYQTMQDNLAWFRASLLHENDPGDIDGDGMPDDYEIAHGLDPCYAIDAIVDADGDGHTSLEEYLAGSHPNDIDSVPGPDGLQAAPTGTTSIALTWDASPAVGALGYSVYRAPTSNVAPGPHTLVASNVATASYTDTGLTEDETYYYVITLYSSGGVESAPSSVASATTEVTPPAAPTGLSATVGGPGIVTLDWNDNAEADLAGYAVYRGASSGFTPDATTRIAANVVPSDFADYGLAGATAYYYVVVALDATGNESAPSAEATATTDATAGGLMAHYLFDETGGATALDVSGHERHGTLSPVDSEPSRVTGKAGGALQFDGTNDCVETTWGGIALAAPRTVAFWIKTTDTTGHGLVSWGDEGVNGAKWHLRVNDTSTDGNVGAIRTEVQGGKIIGTTLIDDGEWHHVVSAFDGTVMSDVVHYVDGALETVSSAASSQAVSTDAAAKPVNIGRRSQGSWNYFDGVLDDVRIYDYALNATEALALYDAHAPNGTPVASDDTASTNEGTPVSVDVLANDSDPDADPLSVRDASQPTAGTVFIEVAGTILYTPPAGFSGEATFTYYVTDGAGGSDGAVVTVSVARTTDNAPTAGDDSYTMDEDTVLDEPAYGVLANDGDVDGDALSAVLVTDVANGTLALDPDGSFTYTPAADYFGSDTFTYVARTAGADSSAATVTITVNDVAEPSSSGGGPSCGCSAEAAPLPTLLWFALAVVALWPRRIRRPAGSDHPSVEPH